MSAENVTDTPKTPEVAEEPKVETSQATKPQKRKKSHKRQTPQAPRVAVQPKAAIPEVKVAGMTAAEFTEKAEEARKQRMDAPLTDAKGRQPIYQKTLINRYAKRFGGQGAKGGMWLMFGDIKLMKEYPHMGFEPIWDNGQMVTSPHGDPLLMCTTELHEKHLMETSVRSDSMHTSRISGLNDKRVGAETVVETEEIDPSQVDAPIG